MRKFYFYEQTKRDSGDKKGRARVGKREDGTQKRHTGKVPHCWKGKGHGVGARKRGEGNAVETIEKRAQSVGVGPRTQERAKM